ncbi:MAG: hypothetical protein JWN36_2537, partial [Microbacteriaceae bacterium]|nr:hypothetical protein [Microbacteriaceae bacterium]
MPLLDATVPLVAVFTVIGAGYFHDATEIRPAGVAISLAASAALGGRRRFPVATFAVTGVLALLAL